MNYSQTDFFTVIKATMPSYQNVAQNISTILGISVNEAYKKMRGKSTLSFNQLIQLCDAFNIPFSYQPGGSDVVTFSIPSVNQEQPNMLAYFEDLLENLSMVHKLKKKHVCISTDDIPLFHFFKYPELASFKMFFWADSIASTTDKFESCFVTPEIIEVTQKINQLYLEIPSTEIWAKDTVHGTIEQIRYAVEAGYLQDRSLAEKILEQLRFCLTDINMYAISSKKTMNPEHTFNWYCCDVLGGISYLVESPEMTTCYNRFNTVGYLKTENNSYCNQTKHWMNGLIRKSVSFSGQGEKHRNRYLYNAYAEIDQMIAEVSANSWS